MRAKLEPRHKVPPGKVPQVRHAKLSGDGYTAGSPLYTEQQAVVSKTGQPPDAGPARLVEAPKTQQVNGPAVQLYVTPLSTTMACIVSLTVQFFIVFIALITVQALNGLNRVKCDFEIKCLINVAETVSLVPMLCILFFAVRMHAIHLTHGSPELYSLPQSPVKLAMKACTWLVPMLTLLELACTAQWGETWESVVRKKPLMHIGKICLVLRRLILGLLYLCIIDIIIGIIFMPFPTQLWGAVGPQLNPAVTCLIALAVLYFTVYLCCMVSKGLNDAGIFGPTQRYSASQELQRAVKATVAFVPMLCILFLSVRLRELQLGHNDPNRWVQGVIFWCTVTVYVQTLVVALSGCGSCRPAGAHPHAKREPPFDMKANLVEGLCLVLMLCIYIMICMIFDAMFNMEHPAGLLNTPPVPLSILCTMLLATLYFFVYMARWLVLTMLRYRPSPPAAIVSDFDLLDALKIFVNVHGKQAADCCPMLALLFLGGWLRAVQTRGGGQDVPKWCQDVEVLATVLVTALTIVRIDTLVPRDPRDQREPRGFADVCTVLQYVLLLCLYACAAVVVVTLIVAPS